MTFMVIVLIITIVLVPIIIHWIRWLYKKWCLSISDKEKSDNCLFEIEILARLLFFDILILVCDLAFIIELTRR